MRLPVGALFGPIVGAPPILRNGPADRPCLSSTAGFLRVGVPACWHNAATAIIVHTTKTAQPWQTKANDLAEWVRAI